MQLDGWTGFLVIVGLIRTLAEVTPVGNGGKKFIVVLCGFVLSYYFSLDVLGMFGLHISSTAWHARDAWMVMNSAVIALATFMGHDALDQLAGKA